LKRRDLALRVVIVLLAGVAAYLLLRRRPPATLALHDDFTSSREGALRVLFVGNSHTFVNDLPKTFGRLVLARDPSRALVVKDVVLGGVTLADHLRMGVAARAIAGERWDFVVLQEQSLMPTMAPAAFEASVRRFDALIRAAHARTAIYELWPRREGQDPRALEASYAKVAADVGAVLVPVGPAWLRAEAADERLVLYQPDGYHPTPAGTYLAACVFDLALTGARPTGLPALGMIAPDVAATLQHAASP
jgi:hypothetical protein